MPLLPNLVTGDSPVEEVEWLPASVTSRQPQYAACVLSANVQNTSLKREAREKVHRGSRYPVCCRVRLLYSW